MSETEIEMPRYQCHKKVWALKIKEVRAATETSHDKLIFIDPNFGGMTTPRGWVEKHKPQPGGYYVIDEDGYRSYSPARAFEMGHTKI